MENETTCGSNDDDETAINPSFLYPNTCAIITIITFDPQVTFRDLHI